MVGEGARVGRNEMIDVSHRETWVEMIEFFHDWGKDQYKDFCAFVVKPASESVHAHHFFGSQSLCSLIISTKQEWPDRIISPHILVLPHRVEKIVEIRFFDNPIHRGDRGKCKIQVSCSYQDAWFQLEKVLAEMMTYSEFNTESK
jgi:hypothetical protein